ncbi:MAG: HIT family protein [Bacteroidetes bacterium]|nr:MAG: HIT family protein [Bacteroidota bacterium]
MPTIFTRIIQGEIPSHRVAENDKFYAFLDINPVQKGHVLLIPKLEQDYIFGLPDELLAEMLPMAKRLARAIESVVPCKRVGMAVIGLEVPHAHIHLIPISEEGDMDFRHKLSDIPAEEMQAIASKIAEAYQQA